MKNQEFNTDDIPYWPVVEWLNKFMGNAFSGRCWYAVDTANDMKKGYGAGRAYRKYLSDSCQIRTNIIYDVLKCLVLLCASFAVGVLLGVGVVNMFSTFGAARIGYGTLGIASTALGCYAFVKWFTNLPDETVINSLPIKAIYATGTVTVRCIGSY